jgi:superfamily II DNA helicase RecQ
VIIFVPRKELGEGRTQELTSVFFHRKASTESKRDLLHTFQTGKINIGLATTAFGGVIDLSTDDVVIHAGTPYDMLDFAQGSGRCGRRTLGIQQ